jgi:hypothetical protein
MHIIMRQNFVPWIPFHAELEVGVPNVERNALVYLNSRHMAVKLLATRD